MNIVYKFGKNRKKCEFVLEIRKKSTIIKEYSEISERKTIARCESRGKVRLNMINVIISKANAKTGIPSFSLLAGDINKPYSGYVSGKMKSLAATISGTCAGTCPGCYALRMTRYNETFNMLYTNTASARENPRATVAAVEREIFKNPLTAPRVFRIHDSGDFFSLEYFAAWCEMIARHPETRFGAYTKAADIVTAYGLENIPANFTLSCSPWEGYCAAIGDLPQFIYDDGTRPEYALLPHCPAVDKNGKRTGITCAQCGHCYRAKNGDKWAVYAH